MTARGENAPVKDAPVKTTDEKKAKKLSLAKNISFAALFAALCCVSTLFISVPLPASGYFNTGDIFVLLAGWFLGPLYGGAAAGVGSMLADIISGYAVYAPATFFVKALDAVAAYLVCRLLKNLIKSDKLDILPRAISALAGEALMVLGYFFYEGVVLGMGMGAAANIIGNTLQGVCCLLCACILIGVLYPAKPLRGFFPKLH